MARTMTEANTGIYRTVVRHEWLEDSEEMTWKYGENYERVVVPLHVKGDTLTKVFGPYVTNAQNQNYSYVRCYRWEETDEPAYKREDYRWMTDEQWENSHYKTTMKRNHIQIAKTTVEYQKLTPVLALQPSGSLILELDWVKYDER